MAVEESASGFRAPAEPVSFRVRPDEKLLLEAVARDQNLTVSAMLREVALDFAREYVKAIGPEALAKKNADKEAHREQQLHDQIAALQRGLVK